MKKVLALLLGIILILSITLVSCNKDGDNSGLPQFPFGSGDGIGGSKQPTVTIPSGYQVFSDEYISVAYPEGWQKITQGLYTILAHESGAGNNIAIAYESKNPSYDGMDAAAYETLVGGALRQQGVTISNVTVERVQKSPGGLKLNIFRFVAVASNNVTMFQTQYVFHVGTKTCVVAVTELGTQSGELAQNTYNTLTTVQ